MRTTSTPLFFLTLFLVAILPATAQPTTDVLVVVNRSSHNVALLDPQKREQLALLPAGKGPQEVAVSPDGAYAYVVNRGIYPEPHSDPIGLDVEKTWVRDTDHTITVINLATRTVHTQFDLGRFTRPHGVWLSHDGSLLWVTAEEHHALLELEATTGTILKVWETPEPAHQVVATVDNRKLYLANTRGYSISVIDRETEHVKTIPTGQSPEGLALSPDQRELWVPNRGDDTISIVDTATDQVVDTIPTHGDFSLQLAFTPDGREVWVSNNNSNDLTVIDARTRQRIATIPLATQPLGLLIPPDGQQVYVTLPRHNGVTVIDARQRKVLQHIPTGIEPDGLAWASAPTAEEITFQTDDGLTIYGDLYLGSEGKEGPLVLAFHQGGGNARAEYGPLVPRLLTEGYTVLTIDQRSGGDQLGGHNRTVDGLDDPGAHTMCDAYRDLEGALRYVKAAGFTGRRVAWGSSYSGSLAIQLGHDYPDELSGILAFSPASGGPMVDCKPDPYLAELHMPLLALRPEGEMALESVQAQFALFQEHGHQTSVSTHGTHGASMLNPLRVESSVEATWGVVLKFLKDVLAQP
ncbi:MAG: hypothetical protein RhofKO_30280 [Rhodothermales bacterium]